MFFYIKRNAGSNRNLKKSPILINSSIQYMYLQIATSCEISNLFILNIWKAISLSVSRSTSNPSVNITMCPW